MNVQLLADLFAVLASIAANPKIGAVNNDVVTYGNLISSGLRAGTLTEADLQQLKAQMEANNAAGHGMTPEQLDEIVARIQANSEAIQNA